MSTEKKSGAAAARSPDQLPPGGGVYRPGEYRKEALRFFRERIGEKQFDRIMEQADSRQHPYVAARLFLSPLDWEKYVWIEQHGSLDGFL